MLVEEKRGEMIYEICFGWNNMIVIMLVQINLFSSIVAGRELFRCLMRACI
jgi:hypothetical protein